jgi:hypothetical protein
MSPFQYVVYCTRSVAELTGDDLLAHLRRIDLAAHGEERELRGMTSVAARHLRVCDEKRGLGLQSVALHYWRPGEVWVVPHTFEPIAVTRKDAPAADLADTLRSLPADGSLVLARIRHHLSATRELVFLEIDAHEIDGVGEVLAEVLSAYVAQRGVGLIEVVYPSGRYDGYDRRWYEPVGDSTKWLAEYRARSYPQGPFR